MSDNVIINYSQKLNFERNGTMNKYLIIFNDGSTLENIITDNFSWMMEKKFRLEEIKKAEKYQTGS